MKPTISRYPVPELKDLPEDLRARILEVQEKAGFVPNVFLALAHRPDEFRAFFAYHDALMLRPSGLSKGEKEMIVVATSAANRCLYCVVAHGAILRVYEKKPLIADQLATNYRKAEITPRQRAMLDFAMKLALDSGAVGDEDIAAVKELHAVLVAELDDGVKSATGSVERDALADMSNQLAAIMADFDKAVTLESARTKVADDSLAKAGPELTDSLDAVLKRAVASGNVQAALAAADGLRNALVARLNINLMLERHEAAAVGAAETALGNVDKAIAALQADAVAGGSAGQGNEARSGQHQAPHDAGGHNQDRQQQP